MDRLMQVYRYVIKFTPIRGGNPVYLGNKDTIALSLRTAKTWKNPQSIRFICRNIDSSQTPPGYYPPMVVRCCRYQTPLKEVT